MLDYKLAAMIAVSSTKIQKDKFDKFVAVQCQLHNLETCATEYQEKIELVFEAISTEILRNPENEIKIRNTYEPKLDYLHNKMQEKVIITR